MTKLHKDIVLNTILYCVYSIRMYRIRHSDIVLSGHTSHKASIKKVVIRRQGEVKEEGWI